MNTPIQVVDGRLTAEHRRDLKLAVDLLENPHFAARLADYVGQPINSIVERLPRTLNERLRDSVRGAILKCLEVAINSLEDDTPEAAPDWLNNVVVGLAGGVGGFFGMAALPVELPITTVLMLRAIAGIARAEGEDLSLIETRLACLEVFALGVRGPHDRANVDYYAARLVLTRLTYDVAALLTERGAVNASTPIIAKLVGEIVARFGLVVSDMSASSIVPVVGAIGGATLNMIFTEHFQRIARGHFTVRRLERLYDPQTIQGLYRGHSRKAAPGYLAKFLP
ncbi:EcsC family protein [Paraburkholderia acidipaludis]|uniref:EcsC family protein n=1 Tax=Paraburkholderia acidipaludis TaxID=660537 RepID=UPI0005BB9632|nr:EcsC family protein [Paraburkholderia acidipaludis]